MLLGLVMNEYAYAKGICNDFDRKGMEDSSEAWGLVVARLGRVLDDFNLQEHEATALKRKADEMKANTLA
jgi:hypothetical protein